MGSDEPKAYSDSDHPTSFNTSWMNSIPDSTKLTQMTIPGTHNSCALHGICCARTQTWSLPEQMNAGLRYFDIRLRLYNNTLRAFHDFVDQIDTFDIILNYALNFLEQNPSESIIMQIVKEYKVENCSKSMQEMYDEYTKDIKDKIVDFKKKDDIKMGDIRGKILMVKIFGRSTRFMPGFLVQNNWTVNWRFSINKKKRKIKEHIHRALAFKNDNKIFLNYLSCSSDYAMMTPYTAAKKCNEIALRYRGRMGIILMDYPGERLINHLIEQNNIVFNNDTDDINKKIIRDGDSIYIIHNDTHKYLYLNENNNENKIYCVKEPNELIIKQKSDDIKRSYFIENDYIILIGKNNFRYEFKLTNVYDTNDNIIYDNSLFKLQITNGVEDKFLENKYENKNSRKEYLLNTTNKPGNFESYFYIQKISV